MAISKLLPSVDIKQSVGCFNRLEPLCFSRDIDHFELAAKEPPQKTGEKGSEWLWKARPPQGTSAVDELGRMMDAVGEIQALLKESRLAEAGEKAKAYFASYPEDNDAIYYMGVVAFQKKDSTTALFYFEQLGALLRRDCEALPESAVIPRKLGQVLLLTGVTQMRMGCVRKARQNFSEAVSVLNVALTKAREYGLYSENSDSFDDPLQLARTLSQNPESKVDLNPIDLTQF